MRRLWVILALSVVANLLLAGMIAGFMLRSPPEARLREVGGGLPFLMALPDHARSEMLSTLRHDRSRGQPDRESMRRAFEALLSSLRAEPFDADEVVELLARQREAAVARQMAGEALLLEQLAAMSAEERTAYADRLEAMLRRGPPPGVRRRGD